MKNLTLFTLEGSEPLKDNQWLVKVRDDNMGFLVKLTKKNEYPKAFLEWTRRYDWESEKTIECKLPVYIVNEDFQSGWRLNEGSKYDMYRIGKSQQWVKVQHPLGFVLEIHMDNFFLDVVPFLDDGAIMGEYKWIGNRIERKL